MPSKFYKDTDNRKIIARTFILKRTKRDVGIMLPACHTNTDKVGWACEAENTMSKDFHLSLACELDPGERFRLIHFARRMCILPEMLKPLFEGNEGVKVMPGLESSSKMDAVFRTLLPRVGNGNGKLVFCHFHQEMDNIASRLASLGITNVATFDGRLLMSKRTDVLKGGFEILILQIQTGCEGLNLQADFSEVYFVSPTWNPAIEEQAIARCHRIGQKKEVHVFKFHMGDGKGEDELLGRTIEEKMLLLQQMKRDISNEILTV